MPRSDTPDLPHPDLSHPDLPHPDLPGALRSFAKAARALAEVLEGAAAVASGEAEEDAADLAAAEDYFAREREVIRIPAEVAHAMLDGLHPLQAWREHRGLTQAELATKAGLRQAYISQLEAGIRGGSLDTLEKLAAALDLRDAALLRPGRRFAEALKEAGLPEIQGAGEPLSR